VRVFLSYRRADVGGYAGRLHDDLVSHLGPKNVFQDVAAIPVGQDFTQVIDRQLDDCENPTITCISSSTGRSGEESRLSRSSSAAPAYPRPTSCRPN
jgi:hypothetical protein